MLYFLHLVDFRLHTGLSASGNVFLIGIVGGGVQMYPLGTAATYLLTYLLTELSPS
jgi:hypothetical protein